MKVVHKFEFAETDRQRIRASLGRRGLSSRMETLGFVSCDLKTDRTSILDLLIHEFSHYDGSGHLTEAFDHNLSRFGAELVDLALRNPEMFKP